jgi:hypothetical protein
MISGADVVDHRDSARGRWLRARRLRVALWLAVAEGIVVAVAPGVSRWTIVAVAVLSIALYAAAGRKTRWDLGYQISWILAASQALAVLVVILAALVFWTALLLVGVFAAIALVILFTDR